VLRAVPVADAGLLSRFGLRAGCGGRVVVGAAFSAILVCDRVDFTVLSTL